MKKRVLLATFTSVALLVIVSTTCFSPVLANSTYTDYTYLGSAFNIALPGQPAIHFNVLHFYKGDHAIGDALELYTILWGPVAIYADNPEILNWWKAAFAGLPTVYKLVGALQLQVCKIDKTIFAYWTVPINAPSETWYGQYTSPAVSLPPSFVWIKGYGNGGTDSVTQTLPSGWTWTENSDYYEASFTFVCPQLKYVAQGQGAPSFVMMDTIISSPP